MLDLDAYLALTRLSAPMVTREGDLYATATTAGPDGAEFVSAIWRIDTIDGVATRMTQPRKGAGLAGVLPDGSLLLRLKRDDPEAPKDDPDAEAAALWVMPGGGGEPRRVLTTPAGIGSVAVARDAGTVVVSVDVFTSVTTLDEDRALAKRRKDAGTTAIWFDHYPIRFWDEDLGPRAPRLFVADLETGVLSDLTPDAGEALRESSFVVTPDGTRVITTWTQSLGRGRRRSDVVAIDVATGARVTLASLDGHYHSAVAVSPDGRWVAAIREQDATPERAIQPELWLLPISTSAGSSAVGRRLAPSLDRWPSAATFSSDSASVLLTADDGGFASVFSVPVDDVAATPIRLTNAGAFSDLQPSPDGSAVYALRSTVGTPPEIVAFAPAGVDQEPRVLHVDGPDEPWPGTAVPVTIVAEDGAELRAWLVLPEPPADGALSPLVVFIHGGPLASWNAWSWRWQPQILAARGYAVLLPDPALSTGYGQAMIERGWQEWGGRPYTDVLALTDAALVQHPLDPERTAVLGGSYGGYLTNWVVGHTDRFRCAVTHASLWDMQQFQGTTDDTVGWTDWWGDPVERAEFYREWSPSTYVDQITTPLLVIHGEQDYRVPVSEGVRLWSDLSLRGIESAFLYLPDENHWVLKPGNIRVWYDAVMKWLDRYLGEGETTRPDLA